MSPSKEISNKATFRETTNRFWILRLITEVREDGVYVRLEPLQRSFRRISPDQIQDVTVKPYAATTYGGWHWGMQRTFGGSTVYRLRGGRGVEVVQTNGERWFIGSQRPAELNSAIERICTPSEK